VPFVVVNPPAEIGHLENGRLSDIAPTLLDILGLTAPAAMTGHSLISPTAGRQAAD
jgi:2,3-bisphosphoglycerate-independent phosphoglycerate mutase